MTRGHGFMNARLCAEVGFELWPSRLCALSGHCAIWDRVMYPVVAKSLLMISVC